MTTWWHCVGYEPNAVALFDKSPIMHAQNMERALSGDSAGLLARGGQETWNKTVDESDREVSARNITHSHVIPFKRTKFLTDEGDDDSIFEQYCVPNSMSAVFY